MQTKLPISKVLLHQSVGFLAIIALCWLIELTGLRKWVLGNHPYLSDFRESVLEMLVVLAVWFLVAASTRRILAHARHLEGFMRVCAWCHHIDFKGEWIKMEDFIERGFDTPTTHGICPHCLAEQKAAIEKAKEAAATANQPEPRPQIG
jgi:hypothetical protein